MGPLDVPHPTQGLRLEVSTLRLMSSRLTLMIPLQLWCQWDTPRGHQLPGTPLSGSKAPGRSHQEDLSLATICRVHMAPREVFYPLSQQTLEVQALPRDFLFPKMVAARAGLQDHAAERASNRTGDVSLCSWHPCSLNGPFGAILLGSVMARALPSLLQSEWKSKINTQYFLLELPYNQPQTMTMFTSVVLANS